MTTKANLVTTFAQNAIKERIREKEKCFSSKTFFQFHSDTLEYSDSYSDEYDKHFDYSDYDDYSDSLYVDYSDGSGL